MYIKAHCPICGKKWSGWIPCKEDFYEKCTGCDKTVHWEIDFKQETKEETML